MLGMGCVLHHNVRRGGDHVHVHARRLAVRGAPAGRSRVAECAVRLYLRAQGLKANRATDQRTDGTVV
eukprot:1427593-Prymnesium_polylepis.2